MKAQDLIDSILDKYVNQDNYIMHKIVPEFIKDGMFLGDYFNFIIYEPLGEEPPRFYHIGSPFDLISHKAPERSLVFRDGKEELNIDTTEYTSMRTGVQDATILQLLKYTSLKDKRILFIGSGRLAKWSLRFMKEIWQDLTEIDYSNRSGDTSFGDVAMEVGVHANLVPEYDLSNYDVIIIHTSSHEFVLKPTDREKIKKGALITSYITSSPEGELTPEFFDTQKANVILDWDNTRTFLPELKTAEEKELLQKDRLIYVRDLADGSKTIDPSKDYTVFRSSGTPMQNLGLLKLLLEGKQ